MLGDDGIRRDIAKREHSNSGRKESADHDLALPNEDTEAGMASQDAVLPVSSVVREPVANGCSALAILNKGDSSKAGVTNEDPRSPLTSKAVVFVVDRDPPPTTLDKGKGREVAVTNEDSQQSDNQPVRAMMWDAAGNMVPIPSYDPVSALASSESEYFITNGQDGVSTPNNRYAEIAVDENGRPPPVRYDSGIDMSMPPHINPGTNVPIDHATAVANQAPGLGTPLQNHDSASAMWQLNYYPGPISHIHDYRITIPIPPGQASHDPTLSPDYLIMPLGSWSRFSLWTGHGRDRGLDMPNSTPLSPTLTNPYSARRDSSPLVNDPSERGSYNLTINILRPLQDRIADESRLACHKLDDQYSLDRAWEGMRHRALQRLNENIRCQVCQQGPLDSGRSYLITKETEQTHFFSGTTRWKWLDLKKDLMETQPRHLTQDAMEKFVSRLREIERLFLEFEVPTAGCGAGQAAWNGNIPMEETTLVHSDIPIPQNPG